MTDSTHSCGYHCDIPACIKQQRDKLAERKPLTELERMKLIGEEFPLALVQPIVIQKIDSVLLAMEKAHGITEKEASNAG